MRRLALPLAAVALVASLTHADPADACGGCFVQQSETTQVTGHRMILSISTAQTTLWDQITYQGNPASFAWVLPIKGLADVGLSSDALFGNLEAASTVSIASPNIQCPPPPSCGDGFGGTSTTTTSTTTTGTVDVVAQEVVGPYETVQLSSQDPAALTDWLTSHGYAVPDDIVPVIAAYVQESFNFLALKLVPGQGIDSMRPVRVTTPGAGPSLPLRMVGAGTGAKTPISLWVFGEGRYEPANFPSFTISESQLVWDWDTQSSNYSELMQAEFTASGGKAWLVDMAEQFPLSYLDQQLTSLAQNDPIGSGYADDQGQGAVEAAQADLAALAGGIAAPSAWVTHAFAELSRPALADDLVVQAAASQDPLPRYFYVSNSTGTPPACPTYPPCNDGTSSGGPIGDGTDTAGDPTNANGAAELSAGGGCSTGGGSATGFAAALALAVATALSARKRRA